MRAMVRVFMMVSWVAVCAVPPRLRGFDREDQESPASPHSGSGHPSSSVSRTSTAGRRTMLVAANRRPARGRGQVMNRERSRRPPFMIHDLTPPLVWCLSNALT